MNSFKESREIFIEMKINKELVLSVSCLQSTSQQDTSASAVFSPIITVWIMINMEDAVIDVNPDSVL